MRYPNTNIGDIFTLAPRHFENISESKGENKKFGLAADACEKERIDNAEVPANKYAPYDFVKDGVFYEIKCMCLGASTFTVSEDEYLFANKKLREGTSIVYGLFIQLSENQYQFIGAIDFETLREISLFHLTSKKDHSRYFELKDVQLLLV